MHVETLEYVEVREGEHGFEVIYNGTVYGPFATIGEAMDVAEVVMLEDSDL